MNVLQRGDRLSSANSPNFLELGVSKTAIAKITGRGAPHPQLPSVNAIRRDPEHRLSALRSSRDVVYGDLLPR